MKVIKNEAQKSRISFELINSLTEMSSRPLPDSE